MKQPLGPAEARIRVGAELDPAGGGFERGVVKSRAAVQSPPSPGLSRELGKRPELEDARPARPSAWEGGGELQLAARRQELGTPASTTSPPHHEQAG